MPAHTPKGLKQTSSQIAISFGLTESAANTFTTERIDLQLNALDNEVFVVTGVKMDLEAPDFLIGTGQLRFGNFVSLSKQAITAVNDLENPSIFATSNIQTLTNVSAQASGDNFGLISTVMENDVDSPVHVDYLDIIATPDFHVNIQGVNQSNTMSMSGKVYGYRARADSSIYAALVQSELLSSA